MSDEDDAEREPATPPTDEARQAKDELFEAIDHFKSAASILFQRATTDPAVKNARKEAGSVAKKLGDAAEPLARQLTDELGRLTKDVMDTVEGAVGGAVEGAKRRSRTSPPPPTEPDEAESDEEE